MLDFGSHCGGAVVVFMWLVTVLKCDADIHANAYARCFAQEHQTKRRARKSICGKGVAFVDFHF